MRTIDGESDELLVALSAQPGSGPGGHARPRQGRGIQKRYLHCLADLKTVGGAETPPDFGGSSQA